uniref:Uncharacterized protein n=1 Tax=Anguilla anguilla TaxID=7936 RepID=A0A0E9RJC8_ANGAN
MTLEASTGANMLRMELRSKELFLDF